ncbi:MAG: hypothetical protein D6696_03695 [Acidobacteria bacterium]|nr:MAG: hypothetical protein D6696_03695 [Acidobacteriota bacterium]
MPVAFSMLVTVTVAAVLPQDGTRPPPTEDRPARAFLRRPNVTYVDTPWLARGCRSGCWNAYLTLTPAYARRARRAPRPEARLGTLPRPAAAGGPGDELRRRIIDGLGIGFLIDGLAERPLAVAVLGESRTRDGTVRRRLLLWDPAVGSFEATLLLPAGRGPFPGVVGLHGHRDDDVTFAEEFLGERLAENGVAVLMPRFRVHDCSLLENLIARKLLDQGLTLLGLRVYETLLMYKVLDDLDAVDARRVGLLSHSGGSSTANLVVRISDAFRAHVADYRVDYLNACGPLDVHCETVSALAPLATQVNDFSTLTIPHLLVPYKFSDPRLRREIVTFFRRHLAG